MKNYLITGGAGFIGTNFVKYISKKYDGKIKIIVLDKLTYAGNKRNLKKELEEEKITFIKGDILDTLLLEVIFERYDIDCIVNFSAESHVDRSIENPKLFYETNTMGTQNLLEVAKKKWSIGRDEKGYPIYKAGKKFIQISTDEVYGTLEIDYENGVKLEDKKLMEYFGDSREIISYGKEFFSENSNLAPSSPYSSSKASGDLIAIAYFKTYKFPINITRCSNNYGEYQIDEKLIPLTITKILNGEKIPVYGNGINVRDWLYVKDHCKAIDIVINNGKIGEIYNIGGYNEKRNIDIVKCIIDNIKELITTDKDYKKLLKIDKKNIDYHLIDYVEDRLGHDMRYAINSQKIMNELGWYPETKFEDGIKLTINWYLKKFISNV